MKICCVQRLTLRWHKGKNCPPLQSEKDSTLCLCLAAISLLSLEQFSNSIPSLLFKTLWVLCVQDMSTEGRKWCSLPSKNSGTSWVESRKRRWVIPNQCVKCDSNNSWHYRVCCPSISVRTFPSSSHLTLVAITLLYWWESEGTEGLVICPGGQNSWLAWWPGFGCTAHKCISFSSMALEAHAGHGGEQGDIWLSCLLSGPTRSHYQHSRKICQKASFFFLMQL